MAEIKRLLRHRLHMVGVDQNSVRHGSGLVEMPEDPDDKYTICDAANRQICQIFRNLLGFSSDRVGLAVVAGSSVSENLGQRPLLAGIVSGHLYDIFRFGFPLDGRQHSVVRFLFLVHLPDQVFRQERHS